MNERYHERIDIEPIRRFYRSATKSIDRLRVRESEYAAESADYDTKMYCLSRTKENIEKSNRYDIARAEINTDDGAARERESMERSKMLATLLESVLSNRLGNYDWLETTEIDATGDSMLETVIASEYDDVINGTDIIGIARGDVMGDTPVVFAMDVSYVHDRSVMRQKMNRANRSVPGREALPRFTRLDFAITDLGGENRYL
ncbi:MAG: hypothetical protein LBH36_02125 [Candidatus Nomurabacteria bacterium]|jgi:hypothetical protein|nr:hypothetical protein [Candidatus Nomurabacteria bacterium]